MASLKTKFSVGLFVLVGLAVAVVTIIWLGMSHYFEKGRYFVAYFDESVQGLDKDSAVKYRGVSVGRVESISVAPDGVLVQVILKIEVDLKPRPEEIVAQLKSVGITGIMFIELDRKNRLDAELAPRITFPAQYPIIDTRPSEIKRLIAGADDVITKLTAFDLEGLSTKFKASLDSLNQAVADFQVKQVSNDVRATLKQIESILQKAAIGEAITAFNQACVSFSAFSRNADSTVTNLDSTIKRIDGVVADNEQALGEAVTNLKQGLDTAGGALGQAAALIDNLNLKVNHIEDQMQFTLRKIQRLSDNLNRLVEEAADHPAGVLLGQPPPPKPITPLPEGNRP